MLDGKQTDLRFNWNLVAHIQHLEVKQKPSPLAKEGLFGS